MRIPTVECKKKLTLCNYNYSVITNRRFTVVYLHKNDKLENFS